MSKLSIEVDTNDPASIADAYGVLHLLGADHVPTNATPPVDTGVTQQPPVQPTGSVPLTDDTVAAATAAAVTPPPLAVPAELDASGIPWDERIHTKAKSKKTDGVWKRKRGIEDAEYERVVAELINAQPMVSETPVQPEAQPQPATPPVQQPATPPVQQPATPPVQQPVVPGDELTWPVVLQKVNAATQAGQLDANFAADVLTSMGVTGGIPMLYNRPDLFAQFLTHVGIDPTVTPAG